MKEETLKSEDEQKRGPGKPLRVLTSEEIDDVKKYAGVLTVEGLADYLMMSRPTFYAILERQPEIFLQYKKEREKMLGLMGRNLVGQAFGRPAEYDKDRNLIRAEIPPNITANIFYLKTHGWKETVNITADEGIGLNVSQNDEQAEKMRQILFDDEAISSPGA